MKDTNLLRILKIGHHTSIRGAGISLKWAINQGCYVESRNSFKANDLIEIISSNPFLIDEWILYSQDKRTCKGFYISKCEIGSIENPAKKFRFNSKEELVANYVIMELDYWSKIE